MASHVQKSDTLWWLEWATWCLLFAEVVLVVAWNIYNLGWLIKAAVLVLGVQISFIMYIMFTDYKKSFLDWLDGINGWDEDSAEDEAYEQTASKLPPLEYGEDDDIRADLDERPALEFVTADAADRNNIEDDPTHFGLGGSWVRPGRGLDSGDGLDGATDVRDGFGPDYQEGDARIGAELYNKYLRAAYGTAVGDFVDSNPLTAGELAAKHGIYPGGPVSHEHGVDQSVSTQGEDATEEEGYEEVGSTGELREGSE
jgi:hypothetical protein